MKDFLFHLISIFKGRFINRLTFYIVGGGFAILSPSLIEQAIWVIQAFNPNLTVKPPNPARNNILEYSFGVLIIIIGLANRYYFYDKYVHRTDGKKHDRNIYNDSINLIPPEKIDVFFKNLQKEKLYYEEDYEFVIKFIRFHKASQNIYKQKELQKKIGELVEDFEKLIKWMQNHFWGVGNKNKKEQNAFALHPNWKKIIKQQIKNIEIETKYLNAAEELIRYTGNVKKLYDEYNFLIRNTQIGIDGEQSHG